MSAAPLSLRDRAGLAGALLLVAVPSLLPYHADPLRAFYQDWLAIAFGLVAALPMLIPRRGESIAVPPMALGLFGLVLVLALQVALGRVTFIESSTVGMLYVTWAALLVMAGAWLRGEVGLDRAARSVQTAFAVGGFLLSLTGFVGAYQIAIGGMEIVMPQGASMVGAVGQRNYFANLIACGLVSMVFLWASARVRTSIAALAGAPMVLALALSASRSAWLFMALLVAFAAFARDRRLLLGAAVSAGLFVGAGWSVSVGWLPIPFGQDAGTDRMLEMLAATRSLELTANDTGRSSLAIYAWHVFLAHPILGAGWSELAWNAFMLAPDLRGVQPGMIDKHCHNLALQLLAETGIVGAACVLAPLLAWFRRRPWRRPPLPETWITAIAAMQAAQAMLELPHWYGYLLGPFALVLGLGSRTAVRCTMCSIWLHIPRALLVAAIAVAAVRLADYRGLERWTAEASAAQRAGIPLSPALLRRLEALDATVFAPEVELIAAQIQTGGGLDARLALNARAMHVFPLPALARQRVELLREAGREGEAERLAASIRAVWGPGPGDTEPR